MKLSKALSIVSATTIALGCVQLPASAADTGSVRVVLQNNTYLRSDGASWDGVLLDTWVSISADSTVESVLNQAAVQAGLTITGSDWGYITEIGGLSEYHGGSMSGWNVLINDWVTSESMSAYTVASGKLSDGDEISMEYSCSWGADIGSAWDNNDTLLSSLDFSAGGLDVAFNPDRLEYVLTLPADSQSIKVTPHAVNKNFQVRTYLNDYTPSVDGSEYKRSQEIAVSDGDKLYVGVGNTSWPTMNYGQSETVYTISINEDVAPVNVDTPAQKVDKLINAIGTVTIKSEPAIGAARAAYNALSAEEKLECTQYEKLVAAEEKYKSLLLEQSQSYDEIYSTTADYLLAGNVPGVGSTYGEWIVFGLARAGKLSDEFANGYYQNAGNYVKENGSAKLHNSKSSDNSRIIIALTAFGYDVTNIGGFNLLEPLGDMDYVTKQGVNGAAWALVAFDTNGYEIPQSAGNQTSREKLIKHMLSKQLDDGGWSLDDTSSDCDVTAMVLIALAPYYNDNNAVKQACDKAFEMLSANQNDDGLFVINSAPTCEGTALVITALTSHGINPAVDERFINNDNSPLDALKLFYTQGGGFRHMLDTDRDQMATEQAFYALASYFRLVEGQTAVFDMSDILPKANPEIVPVSNSSVVSSSAKASSSSDKSPATGACTGFALATIFGVAMVTFKKKRD